MLHLGNELVVLKRLSDIARLIVATIICASLCLMSDFGPFGDSEARAAKASRIPVTSGARLGGDNQRTRFVADLSKPVNFNAYVLPDPFRLIVDMDEVNFQLPVGLGQTGRGLIDAYRYGLFAPGKSRIVMDANAPILIDKSFIVANKNGEPARLVIDIVRTNRETFENSPRGIANSNSSRLARLAREISEAPTVPVVLPRAKPGQIGAPNKNKGGLQKPRRRVVVIDPGHGGVDPGAIGHRGTSEKSVVFSFAKALRRALKDTGRYDVRMTRTKDTFISLRNRVKFARERQADLFIAVHADALKEGDVRGATVYTLSERASDKEAAQLAAKENRSDVIAGVDLGGESDEVADILIDLAQRETKNHSVEFAKKLVQKLSKATKMTGRPHRFAGFRVLKAPDLPSVLLELGYISSKHDEKLLTSASWRRKVAKATVGAINSYFEARIAKGR